MLNNGIGNNPPAFDDVYAYAESNNITPHRAALALESPHIKKELLWPKPKSISEVMKADDVVLCPKQGADLIGNICHNVFDYLQFPKSTAFLHGLTCVSAAMCKSFYIDMWGTGDDLMPCGIYSVSGQPPSTGKSHINTRFSKPVVLAYKELNDSHKVEREKLQREIKNLERDIEKKSNQDDMSIIEIYDQIENKQKRLLKIPEWSPVKTNATPEALEAVARRNNGVINILSAESEALKAVVGSMYGNGGNNYQLLLNAWVGEHFSSERVTRDSFDGFPYAAIGVLAQDDVVESLLSTSADGRGFGERFYVLNEKPLLGYRDRRSKAKRDSSLDSMYKQLIRNIIFEERVVLNFSPTSMELLECYNCHFEPKMKAGGEFSHNMLVGFLGKADIHISKTAAVLHVIDNWQDGGNRSRTIYEEYVIRAYAIYEELLKTYKNASEYMGYTGTYAEIQACIAKFEKYLERNKNFKMSFDTFRGVRNSKPFKGSGNISEKLKNETIPMLEKLNYCLFDGNTIYINPRLK